MSKHEIKLNWTRTSADFNYENYNRTHQVSFKEGQEIYVSAAPDFHGDPQFADPEQVLLAALSSCHMLTFLAIASKSKFVLDEYHDEPVATLSQDSETKKFWISEINLNPKVKFSGDSPDLAKLKHMHDKAHENCFIARSIKTKVHVNFQ
jgi:organic hydroperoxide reductase OsmC/OhrA